MDNIQFTALNYDVDNGIAWASTKNHEKDYLVCLDHRGLIDFKDCRYNYGVCRDHNYSLYGDNLENAYAQFRNFAAKHNAEREFNIIADDFINDVVVSLNNKKEETLIELDLIPDLGDKRIAMANFFSFLQEYSDGMSFENYRTAVLNNNFGVYDITTLDCYDESAVWCAVKEKQLKDSINDVLICTKVDDRCIDLKAHHPFVVRYTGSCGKGKETILRSSQLESYINKVLISGGNITEISLNKL